MKDVSSCTVGQGFGGIKGVVRASRAVSVPRIVGVVVVVRSEVGVEVGKDDIVRIVKRRSERLAC